MPDPHSPRAPRTRLEQILGVPLAEDAVRQWPQSGEILRGRERIAEVESHFEDFKFAVGRRFTLGNLLVVEWSDEYGDGRVYRNATIAELREGTAARVTDYWGEPFAPPPWRQGLSEHLEMPPRGVWPALDTLAPG